MTPIRAVRSSVARALPLPDVRLANLTRGIEHRDVEFAERRGEIGEAMAEGVLSSRRPGKALA
jgi:hypothetical protein